jgi:multidrug resistance efflux pump
MADSGQGTGPSPLLRRLVTILVIVVTAAYIANYFVAGYRHAGTECARTAGDVQWQWYPPGFHCQMP